MARGRRGRPVSGWLLLDKPAGMGSTQAVALVRRALGAAKAGHAGTLDPDATGVLAVALGEATKTVPWLERAPKGYRFAVRWGAETATDDAAGAVTRTTGLRPTPAAVRAALPAFRGDILQVPPQVSAVKLDGARAYDLARAGLALDLAARPLRVDRLDLLDMPDADTALFAMVCGKGGYVRSVARDLGRALGCLGHVLWLRREWSGPFCAEHGLSPAEVERLSAEGRLEERLLPLQAALAGIPEVAATGAGAARLAHGNPGEVQAEGAVEGAEVWVSWGGRALAVGVLRGGRVHPARVFAWPET